MRQTSHFAVTECTDCMQHYVVSLATIYLSVTGERILNNISNNKTTIYKAQVISRVTTKAQKFIILQNLEAGGNRAGLARIVVWLFCGRPKNSKCSVLRHFINFSPMRTTATAGDRLSIAHLCVIPTVNSSNRLCLCCNANIAILQTKLDAIDIIKRWFTPFLGHNTHHPRVDVFLWRRSTI